MNLGLGQIAADAVIVLCNCAEPPRIAATLAGEASYDDLPESRGGLLRARRLAGVLLRS